MAVLGLRFCARAFSSCGKQGPLFIAVRGPLTIALSLVAEHRLQMHRLSSCGSRAQLFHGMWDLPRPGLEPLSPALAGRFSTTVPPGKPPIQLQNNLYIVSQSPASYLHCVRQKKQLKVRDGILKSKFLTLDPIFPLVVSKLLNFIYLILFYKNILLD